MIEEKSVFGHNDSIDKTLIDVFDRDVVAFELHGAVGIFYLLEEALHHEGGEGWIEDGTEQHLEYGEAPDDKDGDPDETPQFATKT